MQLQRNNLSHLLLALAFLISSLSLIDPVMLWIELIALCAVTVRLSLFFGRQQRLPSHRTVNLLAVLSALTLAYFGFELGLLLSMLNLLVLATALKLMSLNNNKDYFRLVTSVFFLISAGFIFQQSAIFTLIYCALIFMLLLSLAYHINPDAELNRHSKLLIKQCAQALPVALLLFYVIPKIEPLWRLPSEKSAETGLSEAITPGDIANLSQSSKLAFRATFTGPLPRPEERYWRALVLEDFDGKTWRVSPVRKQKKRDNWLQNHTFTPTLQGPYYDYEIMLEPTHQTWLYALDLAQSEQTNLWLSQDYQLQRYQPSRSVYTYQVRSFYRSKLYSNIPASNSDTQTSHKSENAKPHNAGLNEIKLNLQLPTAGNPRTRAWIAGLREQYQHDGALIQAINRHFAQGDYRYTLTPLAMPFNPIDQFLFDDKAGFCAHYAGAMVYALRLADIPARIVTGYLGGEQYGEQFLSVFQYDAHAWVEVLLRDEVTQQLHWQRLDPTGLVAPERVLYGLEQACCARKFFSI